MYTLSSAIDWCSRNKSIITFLATGERAKNAVVLTFTHADGAKQSIGGYSLPHCVEKAEVQMSVRKSVANPGELWEDNFTGTKNPNQKSE